METEKKTKKELLEKYAEERSECITYSRVMGYHRPIAKDTVNAGKYGEFQEREFFKEPGK